MIVDSSSLLLCVWIIFFLDVYTITYGVHTTVRSELNYAIPSLPYSLYFIYTYHMCDIISFYMFSFKLKSFQCCFRATAGVHINPYTEKIRVWEPNSQTFPHSSSSVVLMLLLLFNSPFFFSPNQGDSSKGKKYKITYGWLEKISLQRASIVLFIWMRIFTAAIEDFFFFCLFPFSHFLFMSFFFFFASFKLLKM